MKQGRIEICGGIASGKTTLARILEQEGFCAVYERYQDNPFLGEFYKNKDADCSFETEMVFTLLHYKMIRTMSEKKRLVSDYSLLQDLAYGRNNLKKEEFAVFYQMYQYLVRQIAPPQMIIYLKCRAEALVGRIAERAREMEQTVDIGYLSESILALENFTDSSAISVSRSLLSEFCVFSDVLSTTDFVRSKRFCIAPR